MAKTTKENELDISMFFSRENENNGVWFEPTIKGVPSGIEFLVCGLNSNVASVADEEWNKDRQTLSDIKDEKLRSKKEDELFAVRISKYILDIRGKGGKKLVIGGKEVTKDDIYDIVYNSPAILVEISRFASRLENFLLVEKNA